MDLERACGVLKDALVTRKTLDERFPSRLREGVWSKRSWGGECGHQEIAVYGGRYDRDAFRDDSRKPARVVKVVVRDHSEANRFVRDDAFGFRDDRLGAHFVLRSRLKEHDVIRELHGERIVLAVDAENAWGQLFRGWARGRLRTTALPSRRATWGPATRGCSTRSGSTGCTASRRCTTRGSPAGSGSTGRSASSGCCHQLLEVGWIRVGAEDIRSEERR